MNNLIYPLKKLSITQSYTGSTSHFPHTTGTPKDYPIDDNGGDSSKSAYFYCPCDEIEIKRIYGVKTSGTNTIFLRSTKPVNFANGEEDYVCILLTHPDDDTLIGLKKGQKFKRKAPMFIEGKDGNATGYHFHISVGKGDFKGTGWVKNSNGKWVINTTNGTLKPEDAFFIDESFTEIVNSKKLSFKNLPAVVEKTVSSNANIDPEVDPAKDFTKNKAGTYLVTSSIGLRIRAGASTDDAILGVIPFDTKVRCYGYHTGNWLYVTWKNIAGFCCSDYLKKIQ